jgi:hypothetical protein
MGLSFGGELNSIAGKSYDTGITRTRDSLDCQVYVEACATDGNSHHRSAMSRWLR